MTLQVGITNRLTEIVTEEKTAAVVGSGTLPVYGTPCMIALIEKCAWQSVAPFLSEGEGTVGTNLTVDHVAATPLGMEVVCETTLREMDGRRLVFDVEVSDAAGLIGRGTHERFVIANDRFLEKAESKKGDV